MNEVGSLLKALHNREPRSIARAITLVEDSAKEADVILSSLDETLISQSRVLGITGPPGAGKSTLTNQIITRYRNRSERIGVIAIDPSSSISGGAILGDRIRMMQHAMDNDVVMRSMATRGRLGGLCAAAGAAVRIMASSGCSTIIIETVGVGQSEMDIIKLADITALVLAPGLGDDIQAMKAGLLEVADLLVVNKADCLGADALALDLEGVAKDRGERRAEVCMTTASEGTGIEELVAIVDSIDERHRNSGERERRRRESLRLEILDWSLELMRPSLLEKINGIDLDGIGDPKRQARKILQGL